MELNLCQNSVVIIMMTTEYFCYQHLVVDVVLGLVVSIRLSMWSACSKQSPEYGLIRGSFVDDQIHSVVSIPLSIRSLTLCACAAGLQ